MGTRKAVGTDPLAGVRPQRKRTLAAPRRATKPKQAERERIVVYLTPATVRALWDARNERKPGQGRSLGAIIEEAVRKHLKLA